MGCKNLGLRAYSYAAVLGMVSSGIGALSGLLFSKGPHQASIQSAMSHDSCSKHQTSVIFIPKVSHVPCTDKSCSNHVCWGQVEVLTLKTRDDQIV